MPGPLNPSKDAHGDPQEVPQEEPPYGPGYVPWSKYTPPDFAKQPGQQEYNEGPGEPSTFRERVRANPYTGNETIDAGLRSLREDAIASAKDERPYSWPGFFHALATALSGIRGGELTSGGMGDVTPGPMITSPYGIEGEPLLATSNRNILQALMGVLGPAATKDVASLESFSPHYAKKLQEADARRATGPTPVAGVDFPEKQFHEFLGGQYPDPRRMTAKDWEQALRTIWNGGYYTSLPGTMTSALTQQLPAILKHLPKRSFEGLGTAVERAPGELRTDAAKHP